MFQFHFKHGTLDAIHAGVTADHGVVVFFSLAVVAENHHFFAQGDVVGDYSTGLTPSTTYWYAYYASNSLGERFAQPSRAFTTLGLVPVVDDSAGASAVSGTNATLNGVLADGTSAHVYIYWGTNTNSWSNTNDAGTVSQGVPFAVTVNNLSYSTHYYYRCFATNATGSAWATAIPSFTTADAPPPTYTWSGAAGNSVTS